MPRHLSLVAYNTPPTPASQDHSSCETFASTPLRLKSPLFPSHVGPPISSRASRASRAPLEFMASLACESDMNGYASLTVCLQHEHRSGETSRLAGKGALLQSISPGSTWLNLSAHFASQRLCVKLQTSNIKHQTFTRFTQLHLNLPFHFPSVCRGGNLV